jgi:hypothetical protein
VRDFIAHGMLLNVLVSIGAFGATSGPLGELVEYCLPDELRPPESAGVARRVL